jgi:hypothetical protein
MSGYYHEDRTEEENAAGGVFQRADAAGNARELRSTVQASACRVSKIVYRHFAGAHVIC